MALRRNKGGAGGPGGPGDEGTSGENASYGSPDGPPPTPRWLIAAIVVGVLLLFGGIFLAVTSGNDDPPKPTISGESAPTELIQNFSRSNVLPPLDRDQNG